VHELTFLFTDRGELSIAQACSIATSGPPPERYKQLALDVSGNRGISPPSFGVVEFEKAWCVWRCRNHLIHYEPERRTLGRWPAELEPYCTKGWLPTLNSNEHWTSRLPTAQVAKDLAAFTRAFLQWFDGALRFPDPLRQTFSFP